MDQDVEIEFTAASDIPIGHKLAIKPMKEGDTVIKYGTDIGKVVIDEDTVRNKVNPTLVPRKAPRQRRAAS